jgi:hypothetical protein
MPSESTGFKYRGAGSGSQAAEISFATGRPSGERPTVPRELVIAREKEPNVDIENLSFSEFIGPTERLKRVKSI